MAWLNGIGKYLFPYSFMIPKKTNCCKFLIQMIFKTFRLAMHLAALPCLLLFLVSSFLSIPTSALTSLDPGFLTSRSLGNAGAYTAIADDPTAFVLNPAGLSRNAGYRRIYFNGRFYRDFKHWGLNASLIDGMTEDPIHWGFRFDTTRTLELKREQYIFASSYSFRNIVMVGTNTRITQFNRSTNFDPAWIFTMDAGVLGFVNDYLSLGVAVKNFVRSETSSTMAPVSFSGGLAVNLERFRFDFDAERNQSIKQIVFRGGAEVSVTPYAILRGGYFQDRQRIESGYSLGATFRPDPRFNLDVGFLDQLRSSYRIFSLGMTFTL